MANEITVAFNFLCSKGRFRQPFQCSSQIDQDNIGAHMPVVIVGSTAEEVISQGDVATLGWWYARNLDTGNYVDIGPSTASTGPMHPFHRVEPGEPAGGRLKPGTIVKARASTGGAAAVKVQFGFFED